MTLPLTPDVLEAAYELLRATPPFDKWKLPDGDEVKFSVTITKAEYAQYQWDGVQHTISISMGKNGYIVSLLESMAHEMIHLYLEKMGWESKRASAIYHNARFRKFAERVCRIHGFDPKAFY